MESPFFITLSDFPVAPTTNNLYLTIGKRRVPSKQLKIYKQLVHNWRLDHLKEVKEAALYLKGKGTLALDLIWRAPEVRFFTKTAGIRRLDASNRIKACEDALSEVLGINDSVFFRCSIEKRVIFDLKKECIDVLITPY